MRNLGFQLRVSETGTQICKRSVHNINHKLILFKTYTHGLDSFEASICICPVSRKTTCWNCELPGMAVQLDQKFKLPSKSWLRDTVAGQT